MAVENVRNPYTAVNFTVNLHWWGRNEMKTKKKRNGKVRKNQEEGIYNNE